MNANGLWRLTFHCLRHNFVTMIQLLGGSQAIAGALAGHRSAAVVNVYTHIPMEALHAAVLPLPDMFTALPEQGEAV
jgi:integrase